MTHACFIVLSCRINNTELCICPPVEKSAISWVDTFGNSINHGIWRRGNHTRRGWDTLQDHLDHASSISGQHARCYVWSEFGETACNEGNRYTVAENKDLCMWLQEKFWFTLVNSYLERQDKTFSLCVELLSRRIRESCFTQPVAHFFAKLQYTENNCSNAECGWVLLHRPQPQGICSHSELPQNEASLPELRGSHPCGGGMRGRVLWTRRTIWRTLWSIMPLSQGGSHPCPWRWTWKPTLCTEGSLWSKALPVKCVWWPNWIVEVIINIHRTHAHQWDMILTLLLFHETD